MKYWVIGKKKVEIKVNPTRGTYLSIDVSLYDLDILEQVKRMEKYDAINKAKKGKDSF